MVFGEVAQTKNELTLGHMLLDPSAMLRVTVHIFWRDVVAPSPTGVSVSPLHTTDSRGRLRLLSVACMNSTNENKFSSVI